MVMREHHNGVHGFCADNHSGVYSGAQTARKVDAMIDRRNNEDVI
jgi:hypothetical protein